MFQSNRIKLRKIELNDVEQYHTWRNDTEVMYSTNPFLDLYTLEETKGFFEMVILESKTAKSYMVEEIDSGKTIGITSLINIDYKNRNAECILDIGEKDYWGMGYGKEALTLLLDYAFLELNLHRISLSVFSFNNRAIRLYTGIGFVEEGISRQALYRNGEWHDIVNMGILKKDYLSN